MKKLLFFFTFICLTSFANAQWQTCGPGNSMVCIAIKDTNIFVAGFGEVFSSTNNGNSWNAIDTGLSNSFVTTLAVKGTKIFAGTGIHGIYVSSDYGESWTQVNTGLTDTSITALAVHDSIIFAGTYSAGIFLSTNNGASWSAVNNGLTNTNIKTLAINGSNIYAGTSYFNGGVFFSTNNGTNWTLINNGLPSDDIRSLAISGANIFAGYTSRGVFLSTNSGVNWGQVNIGLTDTNIRSLAVYGSKIFAGTVESLFISNINGVNWSEFSDGFVGTVTVRGIATNDTYIFATSSSGGNGVWKRKLSDITGITKINDSDQFSIYPNPATNNITIESQQKSSLEILNIQGQTILKQELRQEKTDIDISGLAEGVYILRLLSNDKTAVTKIVKE